jgi:hypothetical protein
MHRIHPRVYPRKKIINLYNMDFIKQYRQRPIMPRTDAHCSREIKQEDDTCYLYTILLPFVVSHVGRAWIDRLIEHIDDSRIQSALVRFERLKQSMDENQMMCIDYTKMSDDDFAICFLYLVLKYTQSIDKQRVYATQGDLRMARLMHTNSGRRVVQYISSPTFAPSGNIGSSTILRSDTGRQFTMKSVGYATRCLEKFVNGMSRFVDDKCRRSDGKMKLEAELREFSTANQQHIFVKEKDRESIIAFCIRMRDTGKSIGHIAPVIRCGKRWYLFNHNDPYDHSIPVEDILMIDPTTIPLEDDRPKFLEWWHRHLRLLCEKHFESHYMSGLYMAVSSYDNTISLDASIPSIPSIPPQIPQNPPKPLNPLNPPNPHVFTCNDTSDTCDVRCSQTNVSIATSLHIIHHMLTNTTHWQTNPTELQQERDEHIVSKPNTILIHHVIDKGMTDVIIDNIHGTYPVVGPRVYRGATFTLDTYELDTGLDMETFKFVIYRNIDPTVNPEPDRFDIEYRIEPKEFENRLELAERVSKRVTTTNDNDRDGALATVKYCALQLERPPTTAHWTPTTFTIDPIGST